MSLTYYTYYSTIIYIVISTKIFPETVSCAELVRGLMRVLVESVRARESTLVFLLLLWSSLVSRDVHLDTQYAAL